ncbi:MAG: hypothetical protein ABIK84_00410 [candidate division WOR-3 bacterium]
MNNNGKFSILGSIFLVLIILLVGFSIDGKGYLSNILAEMAGFIFSVLVALFLI